MIFNTSRWQYHKTSSGEFLVTRFDGSTDEKYTFQTEWAAKQQTKFCNNLEPKEESLFLSSDYLNSASNTIYTKIRNGEKVVIEYSNGQIVKFDLPRLILVWFYGTEFYKNIVKFCKSFWYGWGNK